MAKRNHTSSGSRDLVKFCAFWGMTIAALFYIFSGFIAFLLKVIKSLNGTNTANVLSTMCSIFTLLGNIAIIIAIAIPAWRYVSTKSRGWKIFYWIMLVVFAFGVVLGMIGSLNF
ncbi:MAG: hypothetical protein K2N33_01665 [Clostridia bacterium]|nr:hypothetical protein [Clostridia bacterium]